MATTQQQLDEVSQALRRLVSFPGFFDSLILNILVYALAAGSPRCKCRTHALALTFRRDPSADPADTVSRFVFQTAQLAPLDEAEKKYPPGGETRAIVARARKPPATGRAPVLVYDIDVLLPGGENVRNSSGMEWTPPAGWKGDPGLDWKAQLLAGLTRMKENHFGAREVRLKTNRTGDWMHCRKCGLDSTGALETVVISQLHYSQELDDLGAFTNALRLDIGSTLYTLYNLLTPDRIDTSHILILTTRRRRPPSRTSPSPSRSPTPTSSPMSNYPPTALSPPTSKQRGLPSRRWTMEVRPDEHFKKRAVFGILEEGKEEDWVKVLKRRAEASAVRKKRGLFPR